MLPISILPVAGILLEVTVSWLHNKYYQIDLPEALLFFGSTHFMPIVSSIAAIIIGVLMAFIWPYISLAFSSLGGVIAGLGGTDNLDTVFNCATRLHVQVKDGVLVDESLLKATGSATTVVNGDSVQVVYGPSVGNVKTSVDALINEGKAPKTNAAQAEVATVNDTPN